MKWVCVLVIVCLAAAAGVGPVSAVEPLDRLVPEETVAFISVRNVAGLLQKVKALPVYKVVAEEGFIEELLPPEAYGEAKDFYETYIDPLGGVFKGGAAFAIIDMDMEGMEPPPMVVLADVSTTEPALDVYLEEVIYPWFDENEDLRREPVRVGGVTLTQIVDDWDEPSGAFGVKDGVFLLFPAHSSIEQAVAGLDGARDKSLADNEWYSTVNEALAGADVIQYVNLGAIDRKAHRQMIEDEWEEEYDWTWGRFHAISGFKMLEAIGQGHTFGPDGGESKICVFGDGPSGGIFEVLAGETPALKSTEYVAGDAAFYLALSLGDLNIVYEQVLGIVEGIDSFEADLVREAIAVLEEFLDKEFEDEILPAFGGEIALVAWVPEGLNVPAAAIMIEVKDKVAVGEMVERILDLIEEESGGEIEIEADEAEGVDVTLIHGVPMVTPAVGIVGDFLVIGTGPGVIGAMSDTLHDGGTLSESVGYTKYVSAIEGDATITLYVDIPRIAEVGLPLLGAYLEGQGDEDVPFGAIEKLAGALSPLGMKVVGTQEGITITSRSDNGGLAPMSIFAGLALLPVRAHSVEMRTPGTSEVEFGEPRGFVPEDAVLDGADEAEVEEGALLFDEDDDEEF